MFFSPWAIVFGKATTLAKESLQPSERIELTKQLLPPSAAAYMIPPQPRLQPVEPQSARELAWFAFWDILIFFGVLLVGFAYLWKRGDLDWVRSTLAEKADSEGAEVVLPSEQAEPLVGAGIAW